MSPDYRKEIIDKNIDKEDMGCRDLLIVMLEVR